MKSFTIELEHNEPNRARMFWSRRESRFVSEFSAGADFNRYAKRGTAENEAAKLYARGYAVKVVEFVPVVRF